MMPLFTLLTAKDPFRSDCSPVSGSNTDFRDIFLLYADIDHKDRKYMMQEHF